MQRLIFTAGDQSISFARAAPFLLVSVTGTTGANYERQSVRAIGQHGETLLSGLYKPRIITIQGAIYGSRSAEQMYTLRRQLIMALRPDTTGALHYENDLGSWEIDATVDDPPEFGKRQGFNLLFSASFRAPDPFWRLPEPKTIPIFKAGAGSYFTWPFTMPHTLEISSAETTIYNGGDVDTPVVIEYAGVADTPRIYNLTTGKAITIQKALATGEKLIINTAFGKCSAIIYKADGTTENGISYLSASESDFWQLVPGNNKVGYAGTNSDATTVSIAFYERFVGV